MKIFLPHSILFGLIFICLTLPEAPPRIIAITEETTVNGSFSVTFSQPLKTDALEEKLSVFKNGEKMAGTLRKTATTLIFSPQEPWESGEVYQIKIAPLSAERGDTATETVEQNLRIRPESLFFLSADNRLMRADPKTGATEIITPHEIEILSFSLASEGRFAAVYGSREDKNRNGVVFGERAEGHYDLTILPATGSPKYSQAFLCNDGRDLVLLSWGENGARAEYFSIDWEQSKEKMLPQKWETHDTATYDKDDLACSNDTSRVLYRKSSGAFVTSFLGEENEDLIGVFDSVVGFSPRDELMLLEKSITETQSDITYRSELSIYRSDGTRSTLSAPNTLFREASFSGNSSLFSLLYIDGEEYASRVETYAPNEAGWIRTRTVLPPPEKRITHHALSLDGRILALEVESGEMVSNVPTDTTSVVLWDLGEEKPLPFSWDGKNPQWEK